MKHWNARYPALKFVLFAFLTGIGAVHAAPMEWNLNSVSFADGTQATGHFFYDQSINSLTNWSVSLTGTAPDDSFTFDNSNTDWVSYDNGSHIMQLQADSHGTQFWRRLLELDYVAGMTSAGGTIQMADSSHEILYGSLGTNGCPGYACNGYTRYVTAGAITTAVPEPGSYAMILAGLALVAVIVRHREA